MESSSDTEWVGKIIGSKFKIISPISHGAFGKVFLAINLKTGLEVAVKVEPLSADHPQLSFEAKLLRLLSGGSGVPELHWFGLEANHDILAMERLGPSIKELSQGKPLSLKTVLMLGDQMLQRIEYIHCRHFLHRDVKPANFVLGIGPCSHIVYLIDFGLAKRFRDSKTGSLRPIAKGRGLLCSVFAS